MNPLGQTGLVNPDWQHVERWIAQDPDPSRADELRALLSSARDAGSAGDQLDSVQQLEELFDGRIQFGTAGLRAALGPGPNRMNRLVVRQTTAGVLAWQAKRLPNSNALIVIGYDARHESDVFASDVARVAAAAGAEVLLFRQPVPTPVLAHAVLEHHADVGVMITASHNPPQDNGYKLYLADGIQLVSPADREIAMAIDEIAGSEVPVAEIDSPAIQYLGPEASLVHQAAAVGALLTSERDVHSVYTAMHGVGGAPFVEAVVAAGFPRPTVVDSQFEPDPDFPTVAFPNPEEPGALDEALRLASDFDADVVVANDPDADRLALAVKDRSGVFVPLSGDQVGILLADHLFRYADLGNAQVAMSLVSSRQLRPMAESLGVRCETTLTGFKWVARPIVDYPDQDYLLGYEEALGYCVGSQVRDKDGITAGLVALEMIADVKAKGETVWDRLDDLASRHGVYETAAVSVRIPDGAAAKIVSDILASPPLVASPISAVTDLSRGENFAPTPGVVLDYQDQTRVIVRPSGTEPKIKAYLEVIEPVGTGSLENAKRAASQRLLDYSNAVKQRLDRE